MRDERYKKIMSDLGMPNSQSLLVALKQVANEVAHEIKSDEKDEGFYKNFYEENRIKLLQYDSLRKNFNAMVDDVLGDDYYYNMAMDVYEADKICCEDVTVKAKRNIWNRIF